MGSETGYRLDKALLREAFNKAVASYDEHAVLQREVARRMVERLDYIRVAPADVLDIGSGTGYSAELLLGRYPGARVIGLDMACALLDHACRRDALRQGFVPLCADMEAVPLADDSVDMVFSSLALQWSDDPAVVFREIARVLKPGGLLMFATFGPDTLRELRASWQAADGHVHVNAFIDMHDLGDALLASGLAQPVVDADHFTLTYDNTTALLKDLKGIGVRNCNAGRRRGLTGRHRLESMQRAYERFRSDGRLPATYEVIYGHAWAPDAADQPRDSGSPVGQMRRQMQVEFDEYLKRTAKEKDKQDN
jgi:malonyl-CoA O-methyltransferase